MPPRAAAIRVTAERSGAHVEVAIEDPGIGIPVRDQPRLAGRVNRRQPAARRGPRRCGPS